MTIIYVKELKMLSNKGQSGHIDRFDHILLFIKLFYLRQPHPIQNKSHFHISFSNVFLILQSHSIQQTIPLFRQIL